MRRLALVAVAVFVAPFTAEAAPSPGERIPTLQATVSSRSITAPDGATSAEEVQLDRDLVPSLLETQFEQSVWLLDWPLSAGVRRDVLVTRHAVYADGARVLRVEGQTQVELPRSSWAFLWGEVDDGEYGSVVVSVDPESETLQGYAETAEGWAEVRRAGSGHEEYVVALSRAFAEPSELPLGFECGEPTLPPVAPDPADRDGSAESAAISTLHKATLAVDTDNELMLLKFANNTTSATNYIASLFALMTAAYERDLRVRLLQGMTFLRVSTTPDPYNQMGTGNADSAKLDEFRDYWVANYATVQRAVAMMLSGKQASLNSASGIAFVNALCSSSSGYSFSQVFKFVGSTASNDVRLVGHEIGHNFGSKHTHCYLEPTPIDTCYNGENGCYTGATSCPAPMTINGVANVRGTIMSYCHLLGGCSASTVFHPRTVQILDPIVESKVGVCVFPLGTPKEASPLGNLKAARSGSSSVSVTYTPACGATNHTVYRGNLGTLPTSGISWSQRHCSLGTSGTLVFNAGSGSVYFVVVGNNGSIEGSYGRGTAGERPPAGAGPGCQYTQQLSGACP